MNLSSDRIRQLAVTGSAVFCVLGTLMGLGVIGTPVAQSSGGSLSSEATLIAPAVAAFGIWSVVYLGLAAYLLWQWLPGNASAARARATGWPAAASMLLNATWLLVTQQGWLVVSVLVIAALVICLGILMARLDADPARGPVDWLVLEGTFGLYLGWVCVATAANIAAAAVSRGVPATGRWSTVATLVVLATLTGVALLLAARLPRQWALGLGIAWGLVWIAWGRLTGDPSSWVVAIAAGTGAVVVLCGFLTAGLRLRPRGA